MDSGVFRENSEEFEGENKCIPQKNLENVV